jgi:hypothetical protein
MVSPELRKIKYGVPELRVAVEGLIPALKTIERVSVAHIGCDCYFG